MAGARKRSRIDFNMEVKEVNKETGRVTGIMIPDPKRYEWREENGERCLFDKFDKTLIPWKIVLEAFDEAINKMNGLPIYHQPQKIKDADEYISTRISSIREMLRTPEPKIDITFKDKSEEFLEALKSNKLGFSIMSIDLVGSTKLATTMSSEKYGKLIQVLLFEMSHVIPKFHGHVLKYTGDGLIAYFPEPSFVLKADLALDCALTIRKLVYTTLNPLLIEQGFEKIDIRMGLDAGEAYIVVIGSPETKQHKDIIGEVVNLATKIQSHAEVGGIYIGDIMQRNLHTNWRIHCHEISIDNDWEYKDDEGNQYKIYKIE